MCTLLDDGDSPKYPGADCRLGRVARAHSGVESPLLDRFVFVFLLALSSSTIVSLDVELELVDLLVDDCLRARLLGGRSSDSVEDEDDERDKETDDASLRALWLMSVSRVCLLPFSSVYVIRT